MHQADGCAGAWPRLAFLPFLLIWILVPVLTLGKSNYTDLLKDENGSQKLMSFLLAPRLKTLAFLLPLK